MIPKDPVMLLSYVNTQLRDYYDSLDDFLKDKEGWTEKNWWRNSHRLSTNTMRNVISLYKEFPAMMGRN